MEKQGTVLIIMLIIVAICVHPAVLAAGTANYAYDDAGRLIRVDDGNGNGITYTYDAAGNLLERNVGQVSSSSGGGSGSSGCFIFTLLP